MNKQLLLGCFAALAASVAVAGEWGQAPNGEFWNGFSTRFINAPAFGFKTVEGAAKYVYEVTDGFINTWWIKGVERTDDRYHTWVNCMLATAKALDNLAAAEKGQ